MSTINRFAGIFLLRCLCALFVFAGAGGHALASITVDSISVSPPATTAVAPGSPITVTITVTLTGGSRWRSTEFSTSPASSLAGCSLAPDINADGTWTRVFTVSAPNTSDLFSLNIIAWGNPNCNGAASPTKTLSGGINTQVGQSLNHVRLVHDGSALTCARETITLQACADATCSTPYTGNVTVALGANAGNWSSNPVTFANGAGTVTLGYGLMGSINLAGTVTSPGSGAAMCYRGSTPGECELVFGNNSCKFDAVEVGQLNNTPIFTKRTGINVELDMLALTPTGAIDTASMATVVAKLVNSSGTGCGSTDLSLPATLTFASGDSGRKSLNLVPLTAARDARVLLTSEGLIQCSSDNFAIRPSTLTVASTEASAANAAGATPTATPVLKAGSDTFKLIPAAMAGYNGTPLVNAGLVQASAGIAGTLAGVGVSAPALPTVNDDFTYSEVGYFKLLPYGVYDDGSFVDVDRGKVPSECFSDVNLGTATPPGDANTITSDGKIGCYFGNVLTPDFGRFIPHHFALSSVDPMVNRSELTSCTAATFTYMGEAMKPSFVLTAQNAGNGTTVNYDGPYARLNAASQLGLGAIDAPASGTKTPFGVCGATPAFPCFTPGAASIAFAGGVSATIYAPLTVFRGLDARGPFANFKVGIAPNDSDGVQLATFNLDTTNAGLDNHSLVGTTAVRYGRLNIDNAYGSELLNLTVKLRAQYWNTTGYVINTDDSCTPLIDFGMDAYLGGITAVNMPESKINAGTSLTNGAGKIVLTKPGPPAPTQKGSVILRSDMPYLPGKGRQTFGVYKSGPVIYVRETY